MKKSVVRSPWSVVKLLVGVAAAFFFFLPTTDCRLPTAWACPGCKEALSGQDPASLQLTQGYARSIFLLMSAPYLLFAGLTFLIVRKSRKKNAAGR